MNTWFASCPQSEPRRNTATANMTRHSPTTPVTFSITENFTRQITSHTARAATGIHVFGFTLLANYNASAIPPTSAVHVDRLIRNDALRFATAMRGPRRSRMISKVARPLTAATRPDICGRHRFPARLPAPPRPGQPETRAHHGIGDQITDVEKSPDRGEDSESDGEETFHLTVFAACRTSARRVPWPGVSTSRSAVAETAWSTS